jgi:serine/threonine protein kinase/tetratricopeptide (TPR) repeat protein
MNPEGWLLGTDTLVDHFRIIRPLGRGGMAEVYLARDTKLGRKVALKVVKPEALGSKEAIDRFLFEARATARFSHPHIVTIHAVGEADGRPYVALEYLEGQSLRERIEQELPSLPEALRIGLAIAEALAEAHKQGILHRDLKPENVMLAKDGRLRVLDFGLAGLVPRKETSAESVIEEPEKTPDQAVKGTPAYMAPEQWEEEETSGATDVWALGCMLYEMVSGRRPFEEPTVVKQALKVCSDEPLPQLDKGHSELTELIGLCLQKSQNKRPTAAEVVKRLEALGAERRDEVKYKEGRGEPAGLKAEQAASSGSSELASTRKLPRRRRLYFTMFVVVGVAAIGIIAGILHSSTTSPRSVVQGLSTKLVVLPFSVRGGEKFRSEFGYLGKGMVDLLSVSLDGVGGIQSVDAPAALAAWDRQTESEANTDSGRVVAEYLQAGLYLVGSLVEVGNEIQLDAYLYDRNMGQKVMAHARVSGEPTGLTSLVDDLCAKLIVAQRNDPSRRMTRLAAKTSSSLEALKAYLAGVDAYRQGRWNDAVSNLQDAVEFDPTFALAYYKLGVAASWGRGELASESMKRAVELGEKLPVHIRRLLRASLALESGGADEGEKLYRDIVRDFPDDADAWDELGDLLFHYNPWRGRSVSEAREYFEQALVLEPDRVHSLIHLAWISTIEDKAEEERSLWRRIIELNPEGDAAPTWRACQEFLTAEEEAKQELLVEYGEKDSRFLSDLTGRLAFQGSNIDDASRIAKLMIETGRTPSCQLEGHKVLVVLELARGRWRVAREHLDSISKIEPLSVMPYKAFFLVVPFLQAQDSELHEARKVFLESGVSPEQLAPHLGKVEPMLRPVVLTYLLALLHVRLGEYDLAEKCAAELENLGGAEPNKKLAHTWSLSVKANIAMEQGRPADALEAIINADEQEPYHSSFQMIRAGYALYLRAEALRTLGKHGEAVVWYRSLLESSQILYKAFALLRLGQTYEHLGQLEKAASHYKRFIELWKDCDPNLRHLVEEAEKGLARIRQKTGR